MAVEMQSHMVALPKAFLVLRIFQLIFALIVLGICIYGAIGAPISGIILNIFIGISTIITCIYYFVATLSQPIIYQYWAILSLEIFNLVFWLISFALLASEVAIAAAYSCGGYYYGGSYYTTECSGSTLTVIGVFGAAAGIGALNFILFIATLALFSVRLARHRKNGGHCVPGAMGVASSTNPEKVEMQPQGPVYAAAPVQAPLQAQPQDQEGYYTQTTDPRYASVSPIQNVQQYQQPVTGHMPEMQGHAAPQQYNPPVQYQQPQTVSQ